MSEASETVSPALVSADVGAPCPRLCVAASATRLCVVCVCMCVFAEHKYIHFEIESASWDVVGGGGPKVER